MYPNLPGDALGLIAGTDQVAMEPVEVGGRKDQAKGVDDDPEEVDDVVAVGGLDERAGWMERRHLHMVRQSPRDEGGAQVDGDGREPNHDDPEEDAGWCVQESSSHVVRVDPARPRLQKSKKKKSKRGLGVC